MQEVTEQQFWEHIRSLKVNVHPEVVGPYPYTDIFRDVGTREEHGRIVEKILDDDGNVLEHRGIWPEGGNYPPDKKYFLPDGVAAPKANAQPGTQQELFS